MGQSVPKTHYLQLVELADGGIDRVGEILELSDQSELLRSKIQEIDKLAAVARTIDEFYRQQPTHTERNKEWERIARRVKNLLESLNTLNTVDREFFRTIGYGDELENGLITMERGLVEIMTKPVIFGVKRVRTHGCKYFLRELAVVYESCTGEKPKRFTPHSDGHYYGQFFRLASIYVQGVTFDTLSKRISSALE
jgi:hypothetical protein